jgi:hypothetical protein
MFLQKEKSLHGRTLHFELLPQRAPFGANQKLLNHRFNFSKARLFELTFPFNKTNLKWWQFFLS